MLLIDITQKCFGYQRTDQKHQTQTAGIRQDNSITLHKKILNCTLPCPWGDTGYSYSCSMHHLHDENALYL